MKSKLICYFLRKKRARARFSISLIACPIKILSVRQKKLLKAATFNSTKKNYLIFFNSLKSRYDYVKQASRNQHQCWLCQQRHRPHHLTSTLLPQTCFVYGCYEPSWGTFKKVSKNPLICKLLVKAWIQSVLFHCFCCYTIPVKSLSIMLVQATLFPMTLITVWQK